MKAKILVVESVELHFTEGENPAMVIGAQGIGPSHKIRQPSPQYFGNTPPQNRQG